MTPKKPAIARAIKSALLAFALVAASGGLLQRELLLRALGEADRLLRLVVALEVQPG